MGDKKSFKRQTEIFRLKEGSLGYFFLNKYIFFLIHKLSKTRIQSARARQNRMYSKDDRSSGIRSRRSFFEIFEISENF